MRFSLIIGTLNRSKAIKYCLESIVEQSFKDFEVIVIDQSKNSLTKDVIDKCQIKNIKYKKVEFTGLSKARNEALRMAVGEFFCLIDDDAYYPNNYLSTIDSLIRNGPQNIIYTGYMWNSITNDSFVDYSKIKSGRTLSIREAIRYCPSPCITFPMQLIKKIGYFDENFGVGSYFGSCEETDYILRALKSGYSIVYNSEIKVIHPHEKIKNSTYTELSPKKMRSYALGFGALTRKHKYSYYLDMYYLETILKDLGKIIIKSHLYKNEFKGHIDGFLEYRKIKRI